MVEKGGISFGNCIKYVLNLHRDILESVFEEYYGKDFCENADEVASRLNRIRNDYVHGNMFSDKEEKNMHDVLMLEHLLYVMRLSNLGLDNTLVRKALEKIM